MNGGIERLARDDRREQPEDVFQVTRAGLRRFVRAGWFLYLRSVE